MTELSALPREQTLLLSSTAGARDMLPCIRQLALRGHQTTGPCWLGAARHCAQGHESPIGVAARCDNLGVLLRSRRSCAVLRGRHWVQVQGSAVQPLGSARARAAAYIAPMLLQPSRLLQPGPLRPPAWVACLLPQLLPLARRLLQELLPVPSQTRLSPQGHWPASLPAQQSG